MREPVYDIHGYPIEAGDVLRSFHYRHRRKLYLYHVACGPPFPTRTGEYLTAKPANWLDRPNEKDGGSFLLTPSTAQSTAVEIVQGLGRGENGELIQWFERPRRERQAA
jgi:hypothetical protein